ncbi:MAG: hypothetical protein HUU41_23225, partial [Bryobacteraceae bacterium]|nr:hypothetical protein [Bryobacteraceae bacterium]
IGYKVVDLVSYMAGKTAIVVAEVVAAVFQGGVVFGEFIAATIDHPDDVLENLLRAAKEFGKTVKEMVSAAVEQAIEDMKKRTIDNLRDIGYSALEVVKAAAEIGGGAVATVVTIVLQWFGDYRPLTAEEMTDATSVYGKSLDLDKVQVAVLSPPVNLIEYLNGERPFTTMYLLNFASWDEVKRDTLIHELTHVWQGLVEGPFYMLQALHAQMGEGYDYGGTTGLRNAGGDFTKFNREQQASIIEDYFRIRFEQGNPESSYIDYVPYAQAVFA